MEFIIAGSNDQLRRVGDWGDGGQRDDHGHIGVYQWHSQSDGNLAGAGIDNGESGESIIGTRLHAAIYGHWDVQRW